MPLNAETEQDAGALLKELKEYLARLIAAIEDVGISLRLDNGYDIKRIGEISEGLGWLVKGLAATANEHHINRKIYDISHHLGALVKAIDSGDEVGLADVLEYELVQSLYDVYEQI